MLMPGLQIPQDQGSWEVPPHPVCDAESGAEYRIVPGFTVYAVGSDGSFWSNAYHQWRELSTYRRPYGKRYVVVSIRADDGAGKVLVRYLHRLVLEAFVGPPPIGVIHGCHGDGDTSNNTPTNLRWDTPAGNAADRIAHGTMLFGEKSPRAKLTDERVFAIRSALSAGAFQKDLAIEHSVTRSWVVGHQCVDAAAFRTSSSSVHG